jgi:hypothetical protein
LKSRSYPSATRVRPTVGSTRPAGCSRRAEGGLDRVEQQRADANLAPGRAVHGGELGVVAESAAGRVERVHLDAGELERRRERVLAVDHDLVEDADRLEGAGKGAHEPAEVATGAWNVCDGDEVDGSA